MYNLEHANAALFASLAVAQGEIENAAKNSSNPHFRSKYADLAEVLNSIRPVFAKHGLSLLQTTGFDGSMVYVTTILGHKDGGYLTTTAACVPAKTDAQGIGSATTYLRRYGSAALAGIAQEDDDGNAAAHSKAPDPVHQGRPTDGAWEAMNEEEQKYLLKVAAKVEEVMASDGAEAAHAYLEGEKLASEEKIALWTRLPSQTRTALKKVGK